MPLAALTQVVAEGKLSPQGVTALLPGSEWRPGHTGGTFYWITLPTEDTPPELGSRLELRRSNQQKEYDIVYKTDDKACLHELRATLHHAKLKGEPVTCLGCQAERFTAEGYTVTIYNQQDKFGAGKVSHPYVLVIHATTDGPQLGPLAGSTN